MTNLMNSPPLNCSSEEQARRQREVDNAILVQTLFGRKLTAAVAGQLRRYVAGELSREQAFAGLYSNR